MQHRSVVPPYGGPSRFRPTSNSESSAPPPSNPRPASDGTNSGGTVGDPCSGASATVALHLLPPEALLLNKDFTTQVTGQVTGEVGFLSQIPSWRSPEFAHHRRMKARFPDPRDVAARKALAAMPPAPLERVLRQAAASREVAVGVPPQTVAGASHSESPFLEDQSF